MSKIKVTLEDAGGAVGDECYRVVSLANTLEPRVGSIITRQDARDLVSSSRLGRLELVIKAAKD
jgi:hypothetical protein